MDADAKAVRRLECVENRRFVRRLHAALVACQASDLELSRIRDVIVYNTQRNFILLGIGVVVVVLESELSITSVCVTCRQAVDVSIVRMNSFQRHEPMRVLPLKLVFARRTKKLFVYVFFGAWFTGFNWEVGVISRHRGAAQWRQQRF